MTAPRKKSPAAPTPRLTRDNWLDAAFNAAVEGGFDAVRVLGLASTLGVTRGSFYWHFTDHADLIAALLARWQASELASCGNLACAPARNPQTDLQHVLDFALAHAGADLENMRFELALRGLGRRDAGVAAMLAEIDGARHKLFEQRFLRLTGDPQVASELAALFYLAIVGSYQALARPNNPPRLEAYLKGLIGKYLIRRDAAPTSLPAAAG